MTEENKAEMSDAFKASLRNRLTQAADAAGVSQEEARRSLVLQALAELGGGSVAEDALTFTGTKFILPEEYKGNVGEAINYLDRYQKQMGTMHDFPKVFRYRPYDVAYALHMTLKEIFGTTGIGEAWKDAFGETHHPELVSVKTGLTEEVQVPWDWTAFPPLGKDSRIHVGFARDKEAGLLGKLTFHAPRHQRAVVEGIYRAIEERLAKHSIYKGKALLKGDSMMPEFLDVKKINPNLVIYSEDVLTQLQANVWSLIEHTDLMRELGEPLKRAVLLEGPYGTGKSLAAFLTAQRATANGWTFLFCRPGDDLDAAMQTAQLYSPAVVFFEDIDVIGDAGDPQRVSKLLDSFDGIGAKGSEVIAMLTTNRKDKIHKGMLRPGRLDAVISINGLDESGVKKLLNAHVPAGMLLDIDYAAVYNAFKEFTPAFAVEAIGRAKRYAIARTGSKPDFLATEDFVGAARSLDAQLDLMRDADEEKTRPALEVALGNVVADVLDQVKFVDSDGDEALVYGSEENVDGMKVDRESIS